MIDSGDDAARSRRLPDELARSYAPRVRRHAARYARRLPRHVPASDLVSAGFVGLVDAFARFDGERLENLEAYLDHRIRGAMLDELREHDPLTRDQRAFARKIAAVTRRLSHALGRAPDAAELATGLGITVSELHGQLFRMNATASHKVPSAFDDACEEEAPVLATTPDEALELRQRGAQLANAIEQLPPRLRDVLERHYERAEPMRQIADALGVTASRVSQMHSEAIARLRKLVVNA